MSDESGTRISNKMRKRYGRTTTKRLGELEKELGAQLGELEKERARIALHLEAVQATKRDRLRRAAARKVAALAAQAGATAASPAP